MIRHITPIRASEASGIVSDVYRQIKGDFGALVDPFVVHSIAPRLLAAVWSVFRESALVGIVPREIKEAVAITVSKSNQCPFCVDAHAIMLHALKAHRVARALVHDRLDRLSPRTQAIVAWASATGTVQSAGLRPPFAAEEAPELIGTAVFYHYINRIAVILFDDTPLPSSRRWLKGLLSRSAGWFFSFAARRPKVTGNSLEFLPEEDLPQDMAWASARNTSARASGPNGGGNRTARPDFAFPHNQIFASDYIQQWEGEYSGTHRSSLEAAIMRLRPDEQSSGRLVLLTALAPHRVDNKVISEFANSGEDQKRLLGALSWASFTAARRIGSWLARPLSSCEHSPSERHEVWQQDPVSALDERALRD